MRKTKYLTDGEMGFRGTKLSKTQINAWLKPSENEEEMPLSLAITLIKRKLRSKIKAKKST